MLGICRLYADLMPKKPEEAAEKKQIINNQKNKTMSKTSKNVLGDQRGRIGKVVGKVVDGVQMYSAYTNAVKDARTPKQVSHRARFAGIIQLGKAMPGAINVGLGQRASKIKLTSAFNLFVKKNMKCITYNAETAQTTVDYEHVELAEGDTPFVTFSGVSFNTPLTATASFASNSDMPGANDDDNVYVVVYAPATSRSMMATGTRASGSVAVSLPSAFAGETVHVWGFTKTSVEETVRVESYGITLSPGECSLSSYVGTGTVLAE